MAYETGNASSINDLLNKLSQFVQAHNWMIDYFDNWDGGDNAKCLLVHKNEIYCGFYSNIKNNLRFGPCIGTAYYTGPYVPSSLPNQQKDLTNILYTNKLSMPLTRYHFFCSDNYIHVVLEITTGSFRHFGCGQLEKMGNYTNGIYSYRTYWDYRASYINNLYTEEHTIPFDACGTSNDGHDQLPGTIIRCDSENVSPRNFFINDSAWSGVRFNNNLGAMPLAGLMSAMPSSLTGRAILLPCLISVATKDSLQSLLGFPSDIRWTRIDNLNPGDTFMIENDKWIAFPIIQKDGPSGQPNSLSYGYAYKIIE